MKKIVTIFIVGAAMTLAGCGRDPGPAGPKESQAFRDLRARKARKVFRASPALKDSLARKGRRDRKARQDRRGMWDRKAIRD